VAIFIADSNLIERHERLNSDEGRLVLIILIVGANFTQHIYQLREISSKPTRVIETSWKLFLG
jgi:hypothetical protein